ncbi:MAG: alpha-ketoacid dehydrogenase subunit beta [Persicimonas sp.]
MPADMPADKQAETTTMTGRQAMHQAMCAAMRADPRVFLMGEDVGAYGGCYAVSTGMLDEFGPERVRDTPLSESGFTGAGIGAALGGMRPIVELMTVNFSLLALDQILNTAATYLHMSGGQFNVPVVIRMATGAGKQLAAQHSHNLEGWFAHIPGIKVVTPSTVADFRWMLPTALEDPDPVLIFEHTGLYDIEDEVDPEAGPVDIDTARVRREGDDLSLITYGGALPRVLRAAGQLADAGVDAEVVDLRTLRPLDDEAIMATATKTRRVVIVEDAWRAGSISAEICARVIEHAFYELDAPIQRVCGAEVPTPYAKHLEQAAFPQVDDIVQAARTLFTD